jgi:hypothetical protein
MAAGRRWRLLAALVCMCAVLTCVSAALVGWSATLHYPQTIVEYSRSPDSWVGAYPQNMPSVRGFAYTLLHTRVAERTLSLIVVSFSALLLLPLLWLAALRGGPIGDLPFACCLATGLLVGYHVNQHDMTLLLLPLCLAANYVWTKALAPFRMLLGGAVVLVYLAALSGLGPPALFVAVLVFTMVCFCAWARRAERPQEQAAYVSG